MRSAGKWEQKHRTAVTGNSNLVLESWLRFYFILNWGLNRFSPFPKAVLARQGEAEQFTHRPVTME